jgi:integrase
VDVGSLLSSSVKREAQAFLDVVRHDLARGEYVDPLWARMTVGEWTTQWMAGRVHLKPKTLVPYESLLKTQILPTWKAVQLAKIGNADMVAWVTSMRKTGLSASRVRQAYHLFGSTLDAAVRDRRLVSNPTAGVDLPRLPKKERRYLTDSQLNALADACGPHRLLVLVLGYTGLGWGKLLRCACDGSRPCADGSTSRKL